MELVLLHKSTGRGSGLAEWCRECRRGGLRVIDRGCDREPGSAGAGAGAGALLSRLAVNVLRLGACCVLRMLPSAARLRCTFPCMRGIVFSPVCLWLVRGTGHAEGEGTVKLGGCPKRCVALTQGQGVERRC